MHRIFIQGIARINEAAKEFVRLTEGHSIIAFYGAMGAGKTTFIKAVCEELGVRDTINSPTFAIVNEYSLEESDRFIYHFDFYRIDNQEEAYNIGTDDYFNCGALCLIEWPEKIGTLLPDSTLNVFIEEQSDGSRTVSF